MRPDMSEFSFGFALTNELIHDYPLGIIGAPEFPTQYAEGRAGGGFDVKLPRRGVPIFLQFKRCECLTRRNAREAELLDLPYYRMYLMPRDFSDQHELLLNLEAQQNEVYYAAPRFHQMTELNTAYLSRQVAERTSFIAPSWIGPLPDDLQHYVSISRDDSTRLFCSVTPREIMTVSADELFRAQLRDRTLQRASLLTDEFLRLLGDSLIERYVEARPQERVRERARAAQLRQQRLPAVYVRELAHMLYDCEVVFAFVDD